MRPARETTAWEPQDCQLPGNLNTKLATPLGSDEEEGMERLDTPPTASATCIDRFMLGNKAVEMMSLLNRSEWQAAMSRR
mmetsp:Transcript_22326/g.33237  ORF Transcript_22326/g.33237 Transcript_22326/m.33237 type:complete len:80 (-) Transcript_22326:34-273(-)